MGVDKVYAFTGTPGKGGNFKEANARPQWPEGGGETTSNSNQSALLRSHFGGNIGKVPTQGRIFFPRIVKTHKLC